jgi:hypothetical protein
MEVNGNSWEYREIYFVTTSFLTIFIKKENTMMRSRNIIFTAFLSSLMTIVLIVVVFSWAGTTQANPISSEFEKTVLATDYLSIAGSDFTPWFDAQSMVYEGVGCVYATEAYWLTYSLALPDKSTITYLRFYYYDTSATDADFFLRTHASSSTGTSAPEVALTSSGTAGYGEAINSSLNIVLDYSISNYVLVWKNNSVVDDTLQLCGFTVGYTAPSIFGSALPLIKK